MKRLLLPVLTALILPFVLGMSKKPPMLITFHAMAAPNDPPKTIFPADLNGKRLYFKLVPEFTQDNIAAFNSFKAENGNGKGMTLQLDTHGKYVLEMTSRVRKDEYLLTMINAKPVDFVVMDEPVSDGMITIWQGVTDDIEKEMIKKYARIKRTGPPTMSKDMEMLPSTDKEKEHFLEATTEQEKAEAARVKKGQSKEAQVPTLNLPAAPTSPKIPVEGGNPPNPPPQGSSADPALPLPNR